MPELIPGYNTEQKVVTVSNSDAAINGAIDTQAEDDWIVSTLILSGANMVILFSRQVVIPEV